LRLVVAAYYHAAIRRPIETQSEGQSRSKKKVVGIDSDNLPPHVG